MGYERDFRVKAQPFLFIFGGLLGCFVLGFSYTLFVILIVIIFLHHNGGG